MIDRRNQWDLPWQYFVLILVWIGGLLAGGLLYMCMVPGWIPAEDRTAIRPFPIGYLLLAILLTPSLLYRGLRNIRQQNRDAGQSQESLIGVVRPAKRKDAATVAIATICIGIAFVLYTIMVGAPVITLLIAMLLVVAGGAALLYYTAY